MFKTMWSRVWVGWGARGTTSNKQSKTMSKIRKKGWESADTEGLRKKEHTDM